MTTPIVDFIKEYTESGALRAHMPGHKGRGAVGAEPFDITEISSADELYCPRGIIKESEENASSLFGTAATCYSAEGSSLCVKAMLFAAVNASTGKKRHAILAGRNAHSSFIHAAVLLDLETEWLYGDSLLSCRPTAEELTAKLRSMQELPDAVFITSPDYLGGMCGIKELTGAAHSFGVPLLVDNAHGAYLKFLPEDLHPITLGADMCCDSAHKTLPALTGAAYLHSSRNSLITGAQAGRDEHTRLIKKAMSLFGSTSPSWLILGSLDACNAYISDNLPLFGEFAKKLSGLKERLSADGWSVLPSDPFRITLDAGEYGYSGKELEKILIKNNIYPEFADPDNLVLMLTPSNTDDETAKLETVLHGIPRLPCAKRKPPAPVRTVRAMTPREAFFSKSETVKTGDAVGRVFASAALSCPPAVPVLVSGEEVTKKAAEILRYYGTESIEVVL